MPAWLLPAALGAIGGGLLSGSKDKGGVKAVADPYGATREAYLNWLNPQIGQPGKKYTGEMVAPLSDQENQSLAKVNQYANTGYGDTFNQAKGEISKTLTNQYDPTTSPYYQAVKAGANRNLEETQKNIASNAGGAGRYYSGGRMAEQNDAAIDVNIALDQILGQLSENERQNRLNVLPQAFQAGQMENQLPLQQATALQTLGGLPREVEQAGLQAAMEDWLRSEVNYPLQIASMAGNTQQPPLYQQNTPGAGSQLMSGIGQMLPQLAMMALMSGCWVAAKVFGGELKRKTLDAKFFVLFVAPRWFRNFYMEHGEAFADRIKNNKLAKAALRPVFELFATLGHFGQIKMRGSYV